MIASDWIRTLDVDSLVYHKATYVSTFEVIDLRSDTSELKLTQV